MFSFAPKNNDELKEIQNRALLKDGVYPFVVQAATVSTSKSGNPMITLRLNVFDKQEGGRIILDYLVAMDNMIHKTKHFCESIGIEDKYEAGTFGVEDCMGKSGWAKVGVQKGGMFPDGTGQWSDKNNIKDYIKADKKPKVTQLGGIDPDFDDDIKF